MNPAFRLLIGLPVLAVTLGTSAAEITDQRTRSELILPVEGADLPPGAYLVSGTVKADGAILGSFIRVPRLHHPCAQPPCSTAVQVEVSFAGVTETMLGAFIDGGLEVEARTKFQAPGGGVARYAVIPIVLSPAALGLDADALAELAGVDSISLDAPSRRLKVHFRFFNPFAFAAHLRTLKGVVRPGTRNVYPFEEAPDLTLPPGETVREVAVPIDAEDLLVITARKLLTEQYNLSVEGRVTGAMTVEIAGRTVELALPE